MSAQQNRDRTAARPEGFAKEGFAREGASRKDFSKEAAEKAGLRQPNCWSKTGVWGDRTCPQLEIDIHCHNCSVYGQAGRFLLDRAEPEGYTAEWTALTASPRDQPQESSYHESPLQENQSQETQKGQQREESRTSLSVMVFRLGEEWLALSAHIFDQAIAPTPVHALPHHRDALLRGIVNVRGQLLPCVSLHELLSMTVDKSQTVAMPKASGAATSSAFSATPQVTLKMGPQGGYSRLVVIKQQQECWAFEVDELYGLHRCDTDTLRSPPALNNRAFSNLTQSTFSWHKQNVSYLEAETLFSVLRQRAL